MKLYISHSNRDKDFVDQLSLHLRGQGHSILTWKSRSATFGRSVLELIEDQLQEADVFLTVLSANGLRSSSFADEFLAIRMLADTDPRKKLLPIVIGETPVPVVIERYHYIRINEKSPSFGKVLRALAEIERSSSASVDEGSHTVKEYDLGALQLARSTGKLTLVCGAGISIGAKIPDWTTLLDRLLDEMLRRLSAGDSTSSVAKDELKDIRENSSLIAGKYLKNVFKGDLEDEVRKALYLHFEESCPIIDAIVELARPKRGREHLESIISFNFDDLLEENLKKAAIEHKTIHSEGVRNSSDELPIFHVHGYLPRSGKLGKEHKVVFSEESYHDQFVDPFSWANLTQLNKFSQNTCLFVGLSLTDPNLRRLLDVAFRRDIDSGARHFAVFKRNSDSSRNRLMESLREDDAASLGISILWVNEFNEIPNLIRDLS